MSIPKISKGAWIRTIVLALSLANGVLVMNDKQPLPISDEDINNLVSAIAVVAAAGLAWWKDNAFTKKARIKKKQTEPPER
jgi:SPP1 family holin